jgi:hypothetical protein
MLPSQQYIICILLTPAPLQWFLLSFPTLDTSVLKMTTDYLNLCAQYASGVSPVRSICRRNYVVYSYQPLYTIISIVSKPLV